MAVEDINIIIEDANETVSVTVNEVTEEVTVIVNDFSTSKLLSQDVGNFAEFGSDGLIYVPTPQSGGNVDSVNGKTGIVVLNTDDISEGVTNKYLTLANIISVLGYTPENEANKVATITGNETSTTLYTSIKSVVDWVTSLFVPKTRALTINGNTQDLSADRTFTITSGVTILNTDILSSALTTKDVDGFIAYINALPSSFAVASNQIQYYTVTDIGMKFMFKPNGRSFGGSEPDIVASDVIQFGADFFDNHFNKDYTIQSRGDGTLTSLGSAVLAVTGTAANITGGSGFYTRIIHKTGVTSATATAGSPCGYRDSGFQVFNFSLGFKINFKFANSDAATVADARCFVGCYSSNMQIGNVNPSTLLNMFGIGSDNGETNLSIMHNDGSGTATKIPLGVNFPANTSKVDVYSVTFWVYPGTTTLYYEVKRENTGHIASGKITTDINTSAVYAPHFWRNSGATALAVNQTFISVIAKLPF